MKKLLNEDFEKVGKSLENTNKNYLSAKSRLNDGIVKEINKKSGIKPKKEIK